MRTLTASLDRHQVALYLVALGLGATVGLLLPAVSGPATAAINPVLGLLLYVTFLGVPFSRVGESLRDRRFLLTLLVVNFLVAPAAAFTLSRVVAHDRVLLVGVLLVLLCPCVDYVIVFTGIVGGSRERLLAAAPLLMGAQMLLLPVYLRVMVGADVTASIDVEPFVEAFVVLLVLPLLAAGLTQAAARTRIGAAVLDVAAATMVPLMMLTLAVVVASQVWGVRSSLGTLALTVPVYAGFVVVMVVLGATVSSRARLDVPGRRAVVLSGTTRNSLVVLPLAVALPDAFALVPLVVVAQTLVELLALVVLVRLVPRIVPLGSA